ncbi:hypothetical protein AOLI_G00280900 [Acnodon oligacanthus]
MTNSPRALANTTQGSPLVCLSKHAERGTVSKRELLSQSRRWRGGVCPNTGGKTKPPRFSGASSERSKSEQSAASEWTRRSSATLPLSGVNQSRLGQLSVSGASTALLRSRGSARPRRGEGLSDCLASWADFHTSSGRRPQQREKLRAEVNMTRVTGEESLVPESPRGSASRSAEPPLQLGSARSV